ncbi:MAG: VWA domain-containing protein [Desulfosarcina sp.]|nr:VWA domain-containing protein [Desulfobacterales bacterium]
MITLKSYKSDTPPIESFRIAGAEGYSEYWRKNKSPIESRELGRVLLALRKLASYIGRNVGEIVWSGMEFKEEAIVLDPRPYMGKYPVSAAKIDLAAGLTIQKAYKKFEWSERIKPDLQKQLAVTAQYGRKFDLFFDTAENIYVDLISNKSVLGLYTEQFRKHKILTNHIEYLQYPTTKGLLYLWWRCAADRSGPRVSESEILESVEAISDSTLLQTFYMKPLLLLCSIVPEIANRCLPLAGIVERGNCRASLYAKIWPELLSCVEHWRYDAASLSFNVLFNDDGGSYPAKDPDDSIEESRIIYLADKVQGFIEKSPTDLTDEIKDNVINREKVIATLRSDIVFPKKINLDRALLARLQRTIASSSKRRTVTVNRGLTSGKIDRKKLYRSVIKGNAFLRKDKRFELENDVILLVDASHSMAFKWDTVEMAVALLFEAITRGHNNIRGFAYSGKGSVCMLSEITSKGNKLFSVVPQGKTASGEAIIAVAMIVKKHALKKPLIIHITDGASNWGCGMQDASNYCSKKKIGLFGLAYGCVEEERETLKQEYGGSVKFIENNQQLPGMLKGALS